MGERLSPLGKIIRQYELFVQENRDDLLRRFSGEAGRHICQTVDRIVKFLECKPPARVLDLASGTGCETIELARRGYEVIGLDCTPAMLEIGREMARLQRATVAWVVRDMRSIRYENEMDYVLMRDVIFGIFENGREDMLVLRNITRAVKPGGRCLFEVYNKEFAVEHAVEDKFTYDPGTDRFVRDKDTPNEIRSVKLYSHEEWQEMLAENGMQVVRMDGWKWKGDPNPPPWRADLIVAEKTPT